MSTIIPKNNAKEFLDWLYLRLKNKHHEDKAVLDRISDIAHNYTLLERSVDIDFIDSICKKHFIDFDFVEDGTFNVSMTEEFKNKLRFFVLDIIKQITISKEEKTPRELDFSCEEGILD